MKALRAAGYAAFFFLWVATGLAAQDVNLRSHDGAVEISGTLLGFDGEFYRVDSIYGELTVDGSGVSCEGPGCPDLLNFVAEMTVSGSSTIGQVLMPALIEAFALRNNLRADRAQNEDGQFTYTLSEKDSGDVKGRFLFRVTNTDEGFADLLADEADIVMSLREIRETETVLAREAGLGDLQGPNRNRVLALDAMVPVVAPANPVNAISLHDLARVLGGQVTNWAQLGGEDAPMTVHLRDERSGISQAVEDRLLLPADLVLSATLTRHGTNEALAQAIADDPFGLGIVSYSEIGNTKPLILIGECGFSLRSTRRTIKTEDYPLTAPMFLYMPARRLPKLGRDFLSFTRSPVAQIVIRRAGFVDQAPEEVPIDNQGDRLANAVLVAEGDDGLANLKRMIDVLTPMKRLTTSFRFEAGSARLDAQSRSNVQQLARSLEAGEYDTRRLLFVGFSDGVGPAEPNLTIARRRAEAVRNAVLEAAETANLNRLDVDIDAFGEAMPMACDDTQWGRQVNRRVEVWVQ
ncbi:substrate-binding domain-containing protein [Pseudoprimorskyibacter insulae]|uniref:Phosphate-binding protein PstS n=1 Tax=Pseudoprimorskyibacter insulae TaxID=1695997 RepID=A0A2R8AU03_9RHOB|nr:phosphate ABC transporter substrate-binding/OmpA family protein [Pseudoprimorskyibacter insulae]SPF79542.1 Phosphate-binding protein PstS [Pseudoprimorskyibacter insulae]